MSYCFDIRRCNVASGVIKAVENDSDHSETAKCKHIDEMAINDYHAGNVRIDRPFAAVIS